MSTLEEALEYKNPDIIQKFLDRYSVSREEALDIFEEMKKWLWFGANTDDCDLFINDSMYMIDEMWHVFITFTKDYFDYCDAHFGRYIHHYPITQIEREKAAARYKADQEAYRDERTEKLRKLFKKICNKLGKRTLYKWQMMYREQYTPEIREKLAAAPFGDKTVTPMFPLSERHKNKMYEMLYVNELEEDDLIEELIKIELASTSMWPNHGCGMYCTCRRM